jgi:hypothetical protein
VLVENIRFPEKIIQDLSRYEKRFTPLRAVLRNGVLGYISDEADETEEDKEYRDCRIYLARYWLAPVVLVRSLDYSLVVGNFLKHAPDFETYRKIGLIPVRDFGNGLVLFKREPR